MAKFASGNKSKFLCERCKFAFLYKDRRVTSDKLFAKLIVCRHCFDEYNPQIDPVPTERLIDGIALKDARPRDDQQGPLVVSDIKKILNGPINDFGNDQL